MYHWDYGVLLKKMSRSALFPYINWQNNLEEVHFIMDALLNRLYFHCDNIIIGYVIFSSGIVHTKIWGVILLFVHG